MEAMLMVSCYAEHLNVSPISGAKLYEVQVTLQSVCHCHRSFLRIRLLLLDSALGSLPKTFSSAVLKRSVASSPHIASLTARR